MVVMDCPWCEAELPLGMIDAVRCEACAVEVEIAGDESVELALAA
jgi:hypothetical protein